MTNTFSFKISFAKFNFEKTIEFQSGLHIIYGESGSGKSGFIHQILGHYEHSNNFILSEIERPKAVQKIFQNPDNQIVCSTIDRELAFSPECISHDTQYITSKVNELKNSRLLTVDGHRHPDTLSGGEKEVLNILTAFSVDPHLLLIDDGLSFLNFERKEEIVSYFRDKISQTQCIIIWLTSDQKDLCFSESHWELKLDELVQSDFKNLKYTKTDFPVRKNQLSIEIINMFFQYEKNESLFNDLNLFVNDFRVMGLTGKNGSGKTTLVKLLTGMENVHSGTVKIDKQGQTVSTTYLDQFPEKMLGAETLENFVNQLQKAKKIEQNSINRWIRNLKQCQIEWNLVKHKRANSISWSTLRLIIILLLLNCQYDLLILDEPTFGLGYKQVLTLRQYLTLYSKNKYLLIISHDHDFLYSFCDVIYDLDQRMLMKKNEFRNIYEK